MNKIKQMILRTTNDEEYLINGNDILACENMMKLEKIESAEDYTMADIMILENILLIIQNYEDSMINIDTFEPFNVVDDIISQIQINYEDGSTDIGYVDLTSLNQNKNQHIILDGSTLYLTIEEDL